MNHLIALLALVVGLVAFFVSPELALKLIALYLIVRGFVGLVAESTPAPVKVRPKKEQAPE